MTITYRNIKITPRTISQVEFLSCQARMKFHRSKFVALSNCNICDYMIMFLSWLLLWYFVPPSNRQDGNFIPRSSYLIHLFNHILLVIIFFHLGMKMNCLMWFSIVYFLLYILYCFCYSFIFIFWVIFVLGWNLHENTSFFYNRSVEWNFTLENFSNLINYFG